MEIEEQKACTQWFSSLMAESYGRGTSENHPQGKWYANVDSHAMLMSHLPSVLVNRIESLWHGQYTQDGMNVKLRDIWPLLTEAELGTIMKAGAANYFDTHEGVNHDTTS